ncbi:MAG: glutamine synthetase [Acidaminobacteraceae bacterium]
MKELLYYIEPKALTINELYKILTSNPAIKFVSLTAVDLGNNHTDERIPIEMALQNLDEFLTVGVQTDGSSVNLPKIAEIYNAKVDIIPDKTVRWIVDYNFDNLDINTKLPCGTLIIPSFLKHEEKRVGSRSVLDRATKHFSEVVGDIINGSDFAKSELGIENGDLVDKVIITSATELEFWVKTPDHRSDIEKLTTSQVLKEQYWKKTVGPVRTSLEASLEALNKFGYVAEMGHKEVGGIPSKLAGMSKYTHIMEQLEVDWKYDHALQTADNELLAKDIIKEVFVKQGLEVTFDAKPIEGVAGSGEHHHIGAVLKLKSGKTLNLFAPQDMSAQYMNPIGFGALMGLLKNYEVINPFITSTNDAFNRLKPGFEAPVCTVCSLGHTTESPSRNRTVLIGLVRDINNPLATRFEIRSPNPNTNSYLTLSSVLLTMIDGIKYITENNISYEDALNEINKKSGDDAGYLEKNRMYRSEVDVFEDFTAEQRDAKFGMPPKTVWENINFFDANPEKLDVLLKGSVFTDAIIDSYKESCISHWTTELKNRILLSNSNSVRRFKKLHGIDDITDLDVVNWEKINNLRHSLLKDSLTNNSLFSNIRLAIEESDFEKVSSLQVEMNSKMAELNDLYQCYKHNLLEFNL